eukprot:896847-Pleurochrysis_carterae.AAC.1
MKKRQTGQAPTRVRKVVESKLHSDQGGVAPLNTLKLEWRPPPRVLSNDRRKAICCVCCR